jgi:hypothetical protein
MSVFWLKPEGRFDDRLSYGNGMNFDVRLCRGNPDHSERQIRPNPLRLEFRGARMADFMWTVYGEPIVTEEVVAAFRGAGITGCEFSLVELQNTLGDAVASDLYEMRSIGWGGMAAKASGIRVLEECPFCKRRVFSGYSNAGELFDLDAWDGSDVFTIWPLPRYLLSVEAVKQLLAKHRFTGIAAVPLCELPKPIAGTLTPGNVRDWFGGRDGGELDMRIDLAIARSHQ